MDKIKHTMMQLAASFSDMKAGILSCTGKTGRRGSRLFGKIICLAVAGCMKC